MGCQGLPDHLQGLWGGGQAGLSHEFLLSLAISRFAELDVRLSVAVPDRDLPSHWALEQVHTWSTALSLEHTLPGFWNTVCRAPHFPGSCNRVFPLLRGQSRQGTFSQRQALGSRVQASRTAAPGCLPPPPLRCWPLSREAAHSSCILSPSWAWVYE